MDEQWSENDQVGVATLQVSQLFPRWHNRRVIQSSFKAEKGGKKERKGGEGTRERKGGKNGASEEERKEDQERETETRRGAGD